MISNIFTGNVMVRKMLSQKCPNLQKQIEKVFENSHGKSYFWLNYTRIYYSTSQLQLMPFNWFEAQSKLIRQHHMEAQALNCAYFFITMVRLDLKDENSEFLIREFINRNEPRGEQKISHTLLMACYKQLYDSHEFWDKMIPKINQFIEGEMNPLTAQILFNVLVMLKLEAPELYSRIHGVKSLVTQKMMTAMGKRNNIHEFKDSYHESVLQVLREQYPNAEEEIYTGVNSIDFFIPEHNLCVEVDGSSHYYNLTDEELSKSKVKKRINMKAGLKMVKLSHHDIKAGSKQVNRELILQTVEDAIERMKDVEGHHPAMIFYELALDQVKPDGQLAKFL